MNAEISKKLDCVKSYLSGLESVLVCYSGGVDSALLLALCQNAVRTEALFVKSIFIPEDDAIDAVSTAFQMNAALHGKYIDPLSIPGMNTNPENRCYLCKHNMLGVAKSLAAERGLKHVIEGSHADDAKTHRPGRKAVEELGVLSPFEFAGIGKAEIRAISKAMGLPSWDKPSFSCLLTRLPHDEPVLAENLKKVELGEKLLRGLGMREMRLRHKGFEAYLELIDAEIPIYEREKEKIDAYITKLGYENLIIAPRTV